MKQVTLCFLRRGDEILLAMKKRGFGIGKWNGVGGKIETGETIQRAVAREAKEEINVDIKENDLKKVGNIKFYFQKKPEWNMQAHVYFTNSWENEPEESEEMRPKWHSVNKLPFHKMWSDDVHWLPVVLRGKKIEGEFHFSDDGDNFEKFNVREV